jgi:hypothetical protein
VRRTSKASSAGSNSGWGAGRRSPRRPSALTALLIALLAAACLLPGSASATEFRTQTGSFGPDGTLGTSFEWPTAQALDQSNKRLYSVDQSAHKIYGFDVSTPGSHPPLGGTFPVSEPEIGSYNDLAADSSSHHIYLSSFLGKKLFGYDESGATLAGFPVAGFPLFPCGTAVDNSGNVWVTTAGEHNVRKYSSAGVLLNTYTLGGLPCRIAFDSEDNLYVANFEGGTRKFTAASGYSIGSSTEIDPAETYAITVDRSTDEVYVVHAFSVSVYDGTGALVYEFGAGGEYYGEFGGIAVDEATEEVFLSDSGTLKVDVFGSPLAVPKVTTEGADGIAATAATVHGTINPKGLAVEDCHFEVIPASQFISTGYESVTAGEKYPCVPAAGSIPADSNPHAVSADATGLEPGKLYHYRLVAKNSIGEGKGGDRQFTSGAAAPLVEKQAVQAVGTNDATVAATINPRGGETTYHVEYGTTNAYGQSTVENAPFGFSADNSKHAVSVHIGGLEAGTAYHFRFVATNEVDTTDGADTTFATYPAASPTFAPCPNDQFRTGAGSRLPDCRAYEQVTPIEKHGSGAQIETGAVSASGDHFTFLANGGLPTSGGLSALVPFLASRGSSGWSADGLLPLTEPGFQAGIIGASEDLSTALVSGEGPGGVNQLFVRNSDRGAFLPGPEIPQRASLYPIGFATDPEHLSFITVVQLLPSAPAGEWNLYDLDHGVLTLADRIPAGSATSCDDEAGPACIAAPHGSSEGREDTAGRNASYMSRDGSRLFFTAKPTDFSFKSGRVYMREDGTRTTWISASQRTTPDPEGEKPAEIAGITPDGSEVFILSCEKLTDDSTAHSTGANTCTDFGPSQGQDLYSYDVETGKLTDLTVDSNPGDSLGAGVSIFLGASEDGSYVYFLANGVLAPGASPASCSDFRGTCNLYVYHDGVIKFIARPEWDLQPSSSSPSIQARVSGDGHTLLFGSFDSLTGYDNVGPCGNGGTTLRCPELFRYSAPDEELLCVSCVPTSLPTAGSSSWGTRGSGSISGTVFIGPSRNLSSDGNRVFFESVDPLVPGDTNGVRDVYEWEAKGEGSCESESQNGGCLYLISSGTDPKISTLLGVSKNGDHVFFFTEQQLVPGDQDQLFDVYDAGVGAGLAAQHELAPPTCASTACQANPPPPPDPNLASAAYSGVGNAHRHPNARKCPKGKRKVRRAGKVSCQKAHKQHKRHNNRGGSK